MNEQSDDISLDELKQYENINCDWERIRLIPESVVDRCLSLLRRLDPEKSKIYQFDTEDKEYPLIHSSLTILTLIGRSFLDSQDWQRCLVLKRLIELTLRLDLIDRLYSAASFMMEELEPVLIQKMIESGVSIDVWDNNSISAIEQAYFQKSSSKSDYLIAGLLLCCLRVTCLNLGPTQLTSALIALRESYAFFRAGEEADALESCQWGTKIIEELDHQEKILPSERVTIGCFYRAVSTGARAEDFHHHRLPLLEMALKYLPEEGDEHAHCLFNIGEEYERRGDWANAIRMYELAQQTPNIQDETLFGIIKTDLSRLRFELENDPAKMCGDLKVLELFGGSPEYLSTMQQLINRIKNRESISAKEYEKAIRVIWDHVIFLEKKNQTETILSQLVLMLPFSVAIKDELDLPVSIEDLMIKAETYLDASDEASRLKYELLKGLMVKKPSTPKRLKLNLKPTRGFSEFKFRDEQESD